MTELSVNITVNGLQQQLAVEPGERLVDTLRDRLRLTGTKEGCGVGECGACSVILDGKLVNSCLILTGQCDGARVETVEGLSRDGKLHPLQQAFIDHNAVQCGFCTPGMLMAAKALLDTQPKPDRHQVKAAISGVLCRCTGYSQIIDAVLAAAGKEGEDE